MLLKQEVYSHPGHFVFLRDSYCSIFFFCLVLCGSSIDFYRFTLGHCMVCPSNNGFCLLLWYLLTSLFSFSSLSNNYDTRSMSFFLIYYGFYDLMFACVTWDETKYVVSGNGKIICSAQLPRLLYSPLITRCPKSHGCHMFMKNLLFTILLEQKIATRKKHCFIFEKKKYRLASEQSKLLCTIIMQ